MLNSRLSIGLQSHTRNQTAFGYRRIAVALIGVLLCLSQSCALSGRTRQHASQPLSSPATLTPIALHADEAAPSESTSAFAGDSTPTAAAASEAAAAGGPSIPIYRGRTDTNAVALTFDAGADTGYAALILDTLERNGIRASFGMTGQWAQAHPELVARMAADGDQLLNHTWDHRSMTGVSTASAPLTRGERASELQRTEDLLLQLTGQRALPYFRAPFGDENASVEVDTGRLGYRYDILWTVDTGGWTGAPVARIIAVAARGASPGAIIVMHVGAESQDGPALQGVIDVVRARGLDFATVADLVGPP